MVMCYLLLALLAGVTAACELRGPVDLGHPLVSRQGIRLGNASFFDSGNLQTQTYFGIRFFNNDFCTTEHSGTHIDAPSHFFEGGASLEQIPLQKLIANGVFLNVTNEVAGNHSFRLQPSHIDAWIERNGAFPDNAILLVSFGWAQLFHNLTLYTGTTSKIFDDFRFPGLSREAVDRIAQIDKLVAFGIDTPSVDPPKSAYAHVTFAKKNFYNLEQVNLDQPCLPEKGFKVYTMPVNVAGGTGAPTRIIAVPSCTA